MKDYIGFTLAEVLITLLIIGIVASLVIPELINDTNKQEYVVALKKSYSDLSQVTKLLLIDYGGDLSNGPFGKGNTYDDLNVFITKLNVSKICYANSRCFNTGKIKFLGDIPSPYAPDHYNQAILSSGVAISIWEYNDSCTKDRGTGPLDNTCGYFIVDVNGTKEPNTFGRDVFMIWITKTGIFPFGCGYADSFNSCTANDSQGYAAKVLQEGAENY